MKLLWVIRRTVLWALIAGAPLASCGVIEDDKTLQELNVNSRYTVESIQVLGLHRDGLHGGGSYYKERTSSALRADLDKIVGEKLDHSALERLAARIKQELLASDVAIKISRGNEPEHVIVDFEVTRSHEQDFDLNVAKFLYDSREGWTGEGGATTSFKGNALTFDVLSDSNTLIERNSGIQATFERKHLGTERLGLRFEFDSYHDQWNPATLAAAPSSMIYRNRDAFTPEATVAIAAPVDLDLGVSFARFRPSAPEVGPDGAVLAAKTESSNAVVSTLRYRRRWGSEHDRREQSLNGSYSLRTATSLLGTDQNYTRHFARLNYIFRHARSFVETTFLAGRITGRAPLFDRFELGDSTTLRGWSKFDLDPLGGSRVIHGSIDYRYRFFQVFYDRGAIWDRPQDRDAKQSIGTGFKVERFQLAVAFPIRGGHAEPILYAGMNF